MLTEASLWKCSQIRLADSLLSSCSSVTVLCSPKTHMVVATLGPRQHQAWVQHVILLLGTLVDVDAPALDFPPVYGDGGVDGHGVVLQGPGLRSLTLDLPTLGISGPKREGGGIRGWGRAWHRRA